VVTVMDKLSNKNLTNTFFNMTRLAFVLALAISLFACDGSENVIDPNAEPDLDQKAMIIMGGRLYDNWIKMKRDDNIAVTLPETVAGVVDNSIVWDTLRDTTVANVHTGEDTWRCVVCHGWDYKGVDGDFATTNFTGFPGLYGNFDALEEDHKIRHIMETIADGFIDLNNGITQPGIRIHAFGGEDVDMLSPEEIESLATFIVYGMIDTDRYISADFKFGRGDDINGRVLFQATVVDPTADCAGCHHENNLPGIPDLVKIGIMSRENPYRALHSILFGKPGKIVTNGIDNIMVGMFADDYTTHEATDVLTFTQTLFETSTATQ